MKKFTEGLLEKHIEDFIRSQKNIDIVIGIPSFNNEKTIGNVISNYSDGLSKYYPEFKCLIINSDGNSTDNTRKVAQECKIPEGVKRLVTKYNGISGKGSALRTIFEIARMLDARVCAVSDADTRSITPRWTYQLIEPVLRMGYGYVTPYYTRDKHDATITNALVYPLTRALYAQRIRQPIGGDFAFTNGALQIFSRGNYWRIYPNIPKFGVDIWMTTTALNEGFRICQTALGAKIHDEKDPGKDLSPMFKQVVGTIFDLIGGYDYKWRLIGDSDMVPIIGKKEFIETEKIEVDLTKLIERFESGQQRYEKFWKHIFSRDTYNEFREYLSKEPGSDKILPIELWTKIVYEFACAYNFTGKSERDILLDAMIPLYYMRTASFLREAELFSNEIADAVVEANAAVFERMKGYLVKRWDYHKKNASKLTVKDKIIS
jgi:glycosyltransferase involved in cell wall biosynthesis